jgi:hypothetical protein
MRFQRLCLWMANLIRSGCKCKLAARHITTTVREEQRVLLVGAKRYLFWYKRRLWRSQEGNKFALYAVKSPGELV